MENKTTEWMSGPVPTVCRCCLAEGCYKDISTEYFWMGKREVYAEMLSETFDISIAYAQTGGPNSHSRLICEPCISRLRDASEFKKQVQECEKTFMNHLDPCTTTVTVEIEPSDKVKLEMVKEEQKHSDSEDFDDRLGFEDDDDDLDDQPLTKLASKPLKKENADILDLLDNSQITVKRKSTVKTKAPPAKKAKLKIKEKAKPSPSKAPAKTPKKKKDKILDRSPNASYWNAVKMLRHSTACPLLVNTNAYRCCFCKSTHDELEEFRAHVKQAHSEGDAASFLKPKQDYKNVRVDITDLRCKKCRQPFASLERLAEHLISKHKVAIDSSGSLGMVPLKLEQNSYVCVVCKKKFNSLIQLSRHTGSHFISNMCDVCGKNFDSRQTANIHKKFVHADNEHLCRRCKKPFPTLEARKEHVRTNTACLPFGCLVCKERFLFWELRENHMVQVHGKAKRIFRCTECEDTFEKRVLLYMHFKANHTNDLKCRYCEKTFGTRRDLLGHVNQHTGERPFKCHVCDKDFTGPSNLSQHLKTHDELNLKTVCSHCPRSFVKQTRLRAHMLKHHPNDRTAETNP